MGLSGYDLSQYPLDAHYEVCRQYMNRLDWNKISEDIAKKGTIGFDISDTISLFPHLALDPDYRLICYVTSEYHGVFGKVLAVSKNDDWLPKRDADKAFHPHQLLNELHIPECTFPPLEAIFNDGSAEGYFEAVLCALFLKALPYAHFEQERWYPIMNAMPDNYEESWDYQVALANWSPRYEKYAITALLRKIENGIGASDGKDSIYLTRFYFPQSINAYLVLTALKTQQSSSDHITKGNRYSENKRCCVFTESSILVATEKHGVF